MIASHTGADTSTSPPAHRAWGKRKASPGQARLHIPHFYWPNPLGKDSCGQKLTKAGNNNRSVKVVPTRRVHARGVAMFNSLRMCCNACAIGCACRPASVHAQPQHRPTEERTIARQARNPYCGEKTPVRQGPWVASGRMASHDCLGLGEHALVSVERNAIDAAR